MSVPLAAALLPPVTSFKGQLKKVAEEDVVLGDALLEARAKAFSVDLDLNGLLDQVTAAVHGGKKPDLYLPLHQLYFGGAVAPSEAKRPILGTQLDVMRSWPGLLGKATQPALVALAQSVTDGVAAAESATAAVAAAQANLDKFRLDGNGRKLFDSYNALAATTFGALKTLVHDHPELKLGSDWAESFFLHETRSAVPTTVGQAEESLKKARNELAAAEQRVAAAEQRLAQMREKQAANEAAAAAASQAKAAVASAKKETAAAKQKEKEAIEAAKKAKKLKG